MSGKETACLCGISLLLLMSCTPRMMTTGQLDSPRRLADCADSETTGSDGRTTKCKKPSQMVNQTQEPTFSEAVVITGTVTPHKQKDSPVETERISGKQIEQAGASRIGQVLQDIPAVQSRR